MARRRRRGSTDPQEEMRGVANSAKTLLANIRFLSVDDPVHTIVITSSVPGEGKTFVSANLASAIATSGETVLLVECDLRRRSMATQLGVHARHGLYSVVSGEVGLLEAVIPANIPNLYFLDAEPHIPNPSDLLNSNRFAEMLQYVSLAFDYVIFDTPPVGTFIDAAVLGSKTDAVFMVVRENFTRRADLKAATEQLSKSGCDLAGVVMNFCENRDSGYYYDYYYSYHRKTDDSNAPRMGGSHGGRPVLDAATALGNMPGGVPQWMSQAGVQRQASAQQAAAQQQVAKQEPQRASAVPRAQQQPSQTEGQAKSQPQEAPQPVQQQAAPQPQPAQQQAVSQPQPAQQQAAPQPQPAQQVAYAAPRPTHVQQTSEPQPVQNPYLQQPAQGRPQYAAAQAAPSYAEPPLRPPSPRPAYAPAHMQPEYTLPHEYVVRQEYMVRQEYAVPQERTRRQDPGYTSSFPAQPGATSSMPVQEYTVTAPSQPQAEYPSPQEYEPQEYEPQEYAPQDYAPQDYAPQDYAPQGYAQDTGQLYSQPGYDPYQASTPYTSTVPSAAWQDDIPAVGGYTPSQDA